MLVTEKDIITLGISFAAFCFSIIAFVVTTRLRRFEIKRTIRSQLSSLVSEMLASAANEQELTLVPPRQRPTPEQLARVSIANQRHAALARQADFLAQQEPDLVGDIEWVTIAQGFATAGDIVSAEDRWRRGVSASPDVYYEIVNTRGLADFLFKLGRSEEARKLYQETISILPDTNDNNKLVNTNTLEMWMESELEVGQDTEAHYLMQKAQDIINTIENDVLQARLQAELESRLAIAQDWVQQSR